MLRGHVDSVKFIRGFFNPRFQRNLSAASIRYADEKDRKRANGVFSWLKNVFKSDDKILEALNAIDREGTVTVLDYSKVNRTSLNNFKAEIVADQNFNSVKTFLTSSTMKTNPDLKFDFPDAYMRLLRNKLLTLPERIGVPVRMITGCNPRNTKPPIREPNMPEKREKKDEKKEKKKRKPVIRTDSDSYQNDHTLEAKSNLHDNMDVNFRHQWGIRIPEIERNDFQTGQTWGQVQHLESSTVVSDMNYTGFQAPSAYEVDGIRLTMSATKDGGTITDTKSEVSTNEISKQPVEVEPHVSKKAEEVESIESLKKILKTSVGVPEVSVVDEEFNIPPGTDFDAEISAWKDLVLKSKVPLDPSKEEFEAEEPNARRVEMLSIRPEPPQPKLDVQVVPSSQDALREEEEEQELSNDIKATVKPMDVKRAGSPTEVQKMDNKKIHTGSLYSLQSGFYNSDDFKGMSKLLNPPETVDKDTKMMASKYSTSSESGWGRLKETIAKAAEGAKTSRLADAIKPMKSSESSVPNIGIRRNNAATESFTATEQQPQQQPLPPPQKLSNLGQSQTEEEDFADRFNAISEREIETSSSRSHQETQESRENPMDMSVHSDQRKFEVDEKRAYQPDDFHNSFDYANPSYEDDYYSGYDSMSLEPVMEKSAIEEKKTLLPPSTLPTEEPQYKAKESDAVGEGGVQTEKMQEIYTAVDDTQKSKLTGTMLSSPPNVSPSAGHVNGGNAINKNEEFKNIIDRESSSSRVETIQPDTNPLLHGNRENMLKNNKEEAELSDLVQRPKLGNFSFDEKEKEDRNKEDSIHNIRKAQLLSVSKQEIEQIYELKNYTYLRPEEMKNLHFNVQPNPRAKEQDESPAS